MRFALMFVLSVFPNLSAYACSLCLAENEESRIMFILTTILLTILPLAVIGGTIRWAVKKAERMREEEDAFALNGIRTQNPSPPQHEG